MKVTSEEMANYVADAHRCAAAAGISRMNIHAANGVAAIMLATGQDIADLVNSGIAETLFSATDNGLRVEVILYNLNVATVGGGTTLTAQSRALDMIGCRGGGRVNKLAEIIAATVVGGEVCTVAAILNGKFVPAHISRR